MTTSASAEPANDTGVIDLCRLAGVSLLRTAPLAVLALLLAHPVRGDAQGLWAATSTTGAPFPTDATTVWTGSKMIVWGCRGSASDGTLTNAGVIYDFATDTWAPISAAGAPSTRYYHAAVWTGSRMIVWGGRAGLYPMADGASYDPITDTWTAIAAAPLALYGTQVVWTGSRMIVWGGFNSTLDMSALGASYDPATNRWTSLSTTNAPYPRVGHTAVWTGSKMIVWGGAYEGFAMDTGGLYDPATNTWTTLSTVGAPSARAGHTAIWTGSKMIVWGGEIGSYFAQPLDTGGIYDLATGTWSSISMTGAPSARWSHSAVWTGAKMIVWGGETASGPTDTGAVYDPATNAWSAITNAAAPPPRVLHAAQWTGTRMLVWGGEGPGYSALDSGGVYCAEPCSVAADLHISQSDGLDVVAPGQTVTYTLLVGNTGPSTASGALVADAFPPAITGVNWTCTASGGADCMGASGSGNINRKVNLPAGGSVSFVAVGTLSAAATGTLSNTATVVPSTLCPDPNLSDNSATDSDAILFSADVLISNTDGLAAVVPGQAITYTIVAMNAGPSPVDGVSVSDHVPSWLLSPSWTCIASGGASCTPGGTGDIADTIFLPVNSAVTYTLGGTLSSNPPSLANTASVSLPAGYHDPDGANNSATDTDVVVYGPTDFFTLTPCRLVDTRTAAGPMGGPALGAGSTRSFTLAGNCGIPSTATALSVNVTAVDAGAPGHLILFRGDAPTAPLVSSINFPAGLTRANNAVVPLAPDGTIQVKNGSAGAVHFVLDVNGYFQ